MDRPYRRYEMLVPLRFNDGRAVPDELIADTLPELEGAIRGRFLRESDNTWPLALRGWGRRESESHEVEEAKSRRMEPEG